MYCMQVYWADVLCLDPVTGKVLVRADELLQQEHASISPADSSTRLFGRTMSLRGGPAPPTSTSQLRTHANSNFAGRGGAEPTERSALSLGSVRVYVTQHENGPSPCEPHPHGAGGGYGGGYGGRVSSGYDLPGPQSTARILSVQDNQRKVVAGVAAQGRALNAYHSGVPPPCSQPSPEDPQDGLNHQGGLNPQPDDWMARLKESCIVAAKQTERRERPNLAGGVQLKMRIAMEYCDLGALRVLCVLCCACRGCSPSVRGRLCLLPGEERVRRSGPPRCSGPAVPAEHAAGVTARPAVAWRRDDHGRPAPVARCGEGSSRRCPIPVLEASGINK